MTQQQAEYKAKQKYRDALDDLLDRPIAYNPAFKRITGSTVAAILLSQAWYWSKRHKEDDGWFYKTGKEWEEETGLTRSEQETARKHCGDTGVLEEDLKGVPATMYYRVNKQKVYELLGVQFAGMSQTDQFAGKQQCGNYTNINKESETPPMTDEDEASPLSKFDDPQFGKIVTDWQDLHTFLIPTHANLLGCMLDEWRDHQKLLPAGHPDKGLDPVSVFHEAMVLTAKNARNPHSLSYMDQIVKNWIANGYGYNPNEKKPVRAKGKSPAPIQPVVVSPERQEELRRQAAAALGGVK